MHAHARSIPLRHANLFEKTEDLRKGVTWPWQEKWKAAGQTIINKQQDTGLDKNNRKQQMQKE
jgi:hypothetical protein